MRLRKALSGLLLALLCAGGSVRAAAQAPSSPVPWADEDVPDLRDVAESLSSALAEVSQRRHGWAVTVEVGGVLIAPVVDQSRGSVTIDYAFRVAYELPEVSFVAHLEHALWRAPELGGQAMQHAINLGFGLERYHRSGLLRTMILVGPSMLARSNDLDNKGEIGLFLDLRPLGFNWRFGERWAMVVDLLHVTLVAPVLAGVPLIDFQFRSSIGVQTSF